MCLIERFSGSNARRRSGNFVPILAAAVVGVLLTSSSVPAQITRVKGQDRGDYRSAVGESAGNLRRLPAADSEAASSTSSVASSAQDFWDEESVAPRPQRRIGLGDLRPVRLEDPGTVGAGDSDPSGPSLKEVRRPDVQHSDVQHSDVQHSGVQRPEAFGGVVPAGYGLASPVTQAPVQAVGFLEDFRHGGMMRGGACDDFGCDSLGCDSLGCGSGRSGISLDPRQWFGSIELMLMFRKGDVPPPLVTSGSATDADVAGELGQAGTVVLAGGEKILDELSVGGRLTLGTWLDARRCRSLVFRGWLAGEQNYNFFADQSTNGVLARPFFDVSDNVPTPTQETQLVVFPTRSSGAIQIAADSEVFGVDVQLRQLWWQDMGATVELLYGYQFMQFNESLRIASSSTSLDNDFAPLGSVIGVSDSFEAENEFHGGQVGLASRYREGCWSFDGLLKLGFGQLSRTATRRGLTMTRVDAAVASVNEGLLVRDSNSGVLSDSTFGWIPELDLSLGWHQFRNFDVTVGYHLVVMTDAVQTSGMIDPNLAVNLSTPATGQQRPSASIRDETFYLHGIHFGLKYVF